MLFIVVLTKAMLVAVEVLTFGISDNVTILPAIVAVKLATGDPIITSPYCE